MSIFRQPVIGCSCRTELFVVSAESQPVEKLAPIFIPLDQSNDISQELACEGKSGGWLPVPMMIAPARLLP